VAETLDDGFAATGLGRAWPTGSRWRWLRLLFAGIWLVYLAQPLGTVSKGHGGWWIAAAVTLTTAFCAVFITVVTCWDRHPSWSKYGLVLLFPLAAAFSLLFGAKGDGGAVVWIYVSSATGWVVTGRRAALRAVAAVAVCFLFFSWLAHDDISDVLITLIPVVFVGITMAGMRTQTKLMAELRQAREEVAQLAASEERLRLARDMHDLTGQSLSMITLKSELAARLLGRLPESAERDRVHEEIEQVATVSRQTLRDIREAISGYRRPTLAVEIITARAALASARIIVQDDPDITLLSGTFDPDAEAALAWSMREAVTNVVRHSNASACDISLTRRGRALSLEVRDDGKGFPAAASSAPGAPGAPGSTGTGLRGMAERLSAVGGSLELHPDTSPGFRLIATVPATVRTPGPARVTVPE
jgi:two-component system, NarL family, sensor histidine kinase DesK